MRLAPLLAVLAALAAPGGAHAAELPGTVILLHAGGWSATGPAVTRGLRPVAQRFSRLGYRTVNLDYAAGPAGLADLEAAYDRERARGRVCVYGESAGGMWAITIARERSVACVIAVAAPIDLFDPLAQDIGAAAGRMLGLGDLPAYDPITHAAEIDAPVLLVNGRDDPIVPLAQGRRMRDALGPDSRLVVVEPGCRAWVHGTASKTSLRAAARAEKRWLLAAMPAPARRLDP